MFDRLPLNQDFIDSDWYVYGQVTFFGFFRKTGMVKNEIIKWLNENTKYPVTIRKRDLLKTPDGFWANGDGPFGRPRQLYDLVFFSKEDAIMYKLSWG